MRLLLIAKDLEVVAAFKPLVSWGHEVWVCESLSGAKKKIAETPLELVVVDEDIYREKPEHLAEMMTELGESGNLLPLATVGYSTGKELHSLKRPPKEDDLFEFVVKLAPQLEPVALNSTAAMLQCDDDEELLHDISEVFLGDAPNQLEKIRDGFRQDNLGQVSSAAHSLKGASGNLAAECLYEAAQQLERASHDRESAISRACFAQVEYQFIRLKRHLKKTVLADT
ncbi:MAG: Hpt domain-containing protein [Candidatus Nitronauta litoralis]|uniref:Hpt domain-containing protein n=1 Tax=Candidatus Nitronauta litoralis TaxID=2705533 RepID=A0A7T0BU74_9BACT|nr:MAG: Hpt domain-containing protein [Candidatus Nitronauta litoralis]